MLNKNKPTEAAAVTIHMWALLWVSTCGDRPVRYIAHEQYKEAGATVRWHYNDVIFFTEFSKQFFSAKILLKLK